jgi:DNA-binding transcriptional MerR regulator
MEKKKRLVKLPQAVRDAFLQIKDSDLRNSYIKSLRNEGWTLASISEVIGMTRERVRQIAANPETVELDKEVELVIPKLPFKPVRVLKEVKTPSPQLLERLLELQPLAQQVRSNALRFRSQAEEYTNLLWTAYSVEGISLYRMSKLLGVTHSALRFRLIRYGYLVPKTDVKSKVYKPIATKNRSFIAQHH